MFKIIDIPAEFIPGHSKPLHQHTKAVLECPKGKCVDFGTCGHEVRARIRASTAFKARNKRLRTMTVNGRFLAWCEPISKKVNARTLETA